MTRDEFIEKFGGVVEHSSWVAERAYDAGFMKASSADLVFAALVTELRTARQTEQMSVLQAHPDLAGKLAVSGGLTKASSEEQASAGLNDLSEEEFKQFNDLNAAYQEKFAFPFIIAVKGLTKADILAAFKTRIKNTQEQEFETALCEVERIVMLRLRGMFDNE